MAYLLALVAFVILMGLGIALDVGELTFRLGNLAFFVDPVSVVFVLVPSIAFAVAAFGWGGLMASWGAPFAPAPPRARAPQLAAALRLFGDLAAMVGVIGALLGVVLLLQNLTDPDALGPALAVALLTYFYGIVIRLVCQAAAARVERAAAPPRGGGLL